MGHESSTVKKTHSESAIKRRTTLSVPTLPEENVVEAQRKLSISSRRESLRGQDVRRRSHLRLLGTNEETGVFALLGGRVLATKTMSAEVLEAGTAFDSRHQTLTNRAANVLSVIQGT
eukprot:384240-Prymnesium_polylepis.1